MTKRQTQYFLKADWFVWKSVLLSSPFCLLGQGLLEFLIGAELAQRPFAHDLLPAFEEKHARNWEVKVAEGNSLLTSPVTIYMDY